MALVFASAVSICAQAVTGTVLGIVTDATGAVVANAKVSLTNVGTERVRSTVTNASGNYTFVDIPEGNYSVSVESTGFKKEIRENINVAINTSMRVDIQLQPGDISQQIQVTAEAPALQTDRADTTFSISSTQTANLPLGVNRNFQSLLNLVPGTTPATFQHSQFFNAESSLQTEVNGQMRMGNEYQIEGIDDDERTGLLQILIPPIEAIQTVDVSTSNYDPELGRASGGISNVILKSGTNSFHGAAYEFVQNSAFDARAFFNPSVGHLAYNYFGGNVGGPIIHNKLFFFVDYLRVNDHEANTNLVTIPSLPFRTGNLSASPTVIYNPFTVGSDPTAGTGRAPFPGNQIPASLINAVSTNILSLVPAPNQSFKPSSPSNNYFALLPFTKTTDSFDTKIDYNITDKDRLSGRLSFSWPIVYQAPIFGSEGGGPAQGAFEGTGSQKTYSSGLNYDHVFSPTLLTELRFGVAYYHSTANQSDYGSDDATKIGVPGVNISPFTSGQVGIIINGGFSNPNPMIGYSASLPWIRAETNIDTVNTWTKIIGNHTIKWGIDLRRVRDNLLQDQTFSPRGLYTFSPNQTSIPGAKTSFGNDFASFLLDVPSQVGRDLNTYFPAYRQWWFFAYGGDKWVVTPKLTLDLGLRWDFYPPATPQFSGGFSNYNYVNNTLVIAGVGGNPDNLGMETRHYYYAPRIGAAYRLTDSTVLRAGFGMSYTPFPDNTYAYNYPVRANNAYNPAGNGFGPALLANGAPATFQAGFPAPVPIVVPSNGIITNPPVAQNYFVIPLTYENPYVESWNFAVQQGLPWHFTLDTAYVGNHGVRTSAQYNLNAGFVLGAGSMGQPQFPRTAASTQYFYGFSSSYNALQVKFNRQFSNGLLITTSFSWGKGMDFQQGDDGQLMFYVDVPRNYARTDFDRTVSYVQSFVYQLPWGKGKRWMNSGWVSSVLGNWQLSGIISAYTGTPMTFTVNGFNNNGGNLKTPSNTQTPNQIAPIQVLHGINTNPWFSTASFAQPVGPVFGTLGRNVISGPGLFSLNLSLFKDFAFKERWHFEIRCDTFNLTNTPEFANPATDITSSTFGRVTSTLGSGTGVNGTGGGRGLQLGAKLSF
ncbi:MAG: TonB-dependent receptor [Acidobacteriaceae bacterium]|nr:TonB-dependent receptor [Acidobacteriaceae bacterium]